MGDGLTVATPVMPQLLAGPAVTSYPAGASIPTPQVSNPNAPATCCLGASIELQVTP